MNDRQLYGLTNPQKRIWYTEQIYLPDHPPFHVISGYSHVAADIDIEEFKKAILQFIKNNEGIRLRFFEEGAEVSQYIAPYEEQEIDFFDFNVYDDPDQEFESFIRQQTGSAFEYDQALFYICTYKIHDKYGMYARIHHLISDGWSLELFVARIYANYKKIIKHEYTPEEDPSYLQYIKMEDRYINSERFNKDRAFFLEQFSELPEAGASKNEYTLAGKRKSFFLDEETSSAIREFIRTCNISLNTFFTALMVIYLTKKSGKDDTVIGIPVLNRVGKQERAIFGMFTSTMPFKYSFSRENISFTDFVKKIHREIKKYLVHQRYPYNYLVNDLKLSQKGRSGLFDICVNYYNTTMKETVDGKPVHIQECYSGLQTYSLQLIVRDWLDSGRISLDFDYKCCDYSDEKIDIIFTYLQNMICTVLDNTAIDVFKISLLDETMLNQAVYDFNKTRADYPQNKTVLHLFKEQAALNPHRIALEFEDRVLTYGELDDYSNHVAGFLAEKKVRKEEKIGLMTSHSISTVVTILGILKAGAAYIPIDPAYPEERINHILDDSRVQYVFTNQTLPPAVTERITTIDISDLEYFRQFESVTTLKADPGSLAYIIYTSGSTGKPKGVMIEHGGLMNYIYWANKMYVKDKNDCFALYSSLSFDLTVTSVFTPLISGNSIRIYYDDGSDFILSKVFDENRVTVVKLTPSHLSLLTNRDNSQSSIKRFIVGGEDLKCDLAKNVHNSFKGGIEIYNEYGPTETVVGCMIYQYDPGRDLTGSVPIGKPADNVQIYLLDRELQPAVDSAIGQMYISGDGVARGYHGNKGLTEDRFVANPYIPGTRMYKTGDLARFNEAGDLVYMGRCDNQVKIRGFRIELSEIENEIIQFEKIKNVIVLAVQDDRNNNYLCAYYQAEKLIEVPVLRDSLLKTLPDYMVPQFFVHMQNLPLTANGKIDTARLEPIDFSQSVSKKSNYKKSDKEEAITRVAAGVLNLENIDMEDNFYHAGGDSIKAIQLKQRLNEIGYDIQIKDIFSYPFFKDLVKQVTEKKAASAAKKVEGVCKNTPIISWFLSSGLKQKHHYHQSALLSLDPAVAADDLEAVLREIILYHDSLRLNYDNETLFYNPAHLENKKIISGYDLSKLEKDKQDKKITELGAREKESFNLAEDLLFKALFFDKGKNGKSLLLIAHHIVIDGVSWRILLDDLNILLDKRLAGLTHVLPEKSASYQEWAEVLHQFSSRIPENDARYWQEIGRSRFDFPGNSRDLSPGLVSHSKTAAVTMDKEETRLLLTGANRTYNTNPGDLMLIALALSLSKKAKMEQVLIEVEGHGRERLAETIDIHRTVGWFTMIYPLLLTVKEADMVQAVKSLKEQIKKAAAKGIQWGILKELAHMIEQKPAQLIRFNYLGDFDNINQFSHFSLIRQDTGSDYAMDNKLTALIDINGMVLNGELTFSFLYNPDNFDELWIKNFIDEYLVNLKELILHCMNKVEIEFTPSDFEAAIIDQEELDNLFE